MNKRLFKVVLSLIFFFTPLFSFSQSLPKGKISGLVFGDYYYILSDHDSNLKDRNGFWFRRIYLTYDQDLLHNFSMRLRLEMAHKGDFESKEAAVPFVKDAYLKYKTKSTEIILGTSPTPTFNIIEKFWGYRAVEKTPADLYKMASSRETGLAVKVKFGPSQKAYFHAMVGNGNAQKSENNKGKKVLLSLGYNVTNNLLFEAYGDYETLPETKRRYTYQGFMAYQNSSLRAGLMYVNQLRTQSGKSAVNRRLVSAFATYHLKKNLSFFSRVDKLFDPVTDGKNISYIPVDSSAKATFMVFGLDYLFLKTLHLIPNIELVFYDGAQKPDNDIIPRITFFYKFK